MKQIRHYVVKAINMIILSKYEVLLLLNDKMFTVIDFEVDCFAPIYFELTTFENAVSSDLVSNSLLELVQGIYSEKLQLQDHV